MPKQNGCQLQTLEGEEGRRGEGRGVPGLCGMRRDVPFARQRRPVVGVLGLCPPPLSPAKHVPVLYPRAST